MTQGCRRWSRSHLSIGPSIHQGGKLHFNQKTLVVHEVNDFSSRSLPFFLSVQKHVLDDDKVCWRRIQQRSSGSRADPAIRAGQIVSAQKQQTLGLEAKDGKNHVVTMMLKNLRCNIKMFILPKKRLQLQTESPAATSYTDLCCFSRMSENMGMGRVISFNFLSLTGSSASLWFSPLKQFSSLLRD